MKLSDLLDELRNNILYDRDVSTGDDAKLWSDATLVRYINEAQKRFAKRAFIIWDSKTAEVCQVTLREGVTQYDLHPAILSVVSAKLDGSDYDLIRIGHMRLGDLSTPGNDVTFVPSDHHIEMLDWAAYLALRIVDQDAGNPKRAADFAASFEQHVQDARKLVLRKLGTPPRWGFGRGGFSWGS
jgi:hypothetical protein